MKGIKAIGIEVMVHATLLQLAEFFHSSVMTDLATYKQLASVSIVNRQADAMNDVADKLFTRELLGCDS